jgi:hypothetical protein
MKKLTLSLCAVAALVSAAYAGPATVRSSGKEMQQAAAPATSCFGDREWNFDLWGSYALTGNEYRDDRYLQADHAFGGGLGVNYFFTRYLGVGLQGSALEAHEDAFGAINGNFIFRYPIPNSCWAPYVFTGGGVLFNGSNVADRVAAARFAAARKSSDSELVGDFGGGIE